MDTLDEAVSAVDSQITMLEATCKELQADSRILRVKVNELWGPLLQDELQNCVHQGRSRKQLFHGFCISTNSDAAE